MEPSGVVQRGTHAAAAQAARANNDSYWPNCPAWPQPKSALSAVYVAAVTDIYHRDNAHLVVNPVDDAVGAAACAEPIGQRRQQSFADTMRFPQQGTSHELICRCCHCLRQALGECTPDCRRGPQNVWFLRGLVAHFSAGPRCRIASASSSAETVSPRASSASDSIRRRVVSASRRIASVSSSCSRSSMATRTADGRPWTVTVTRSW